MADRNEVIQQLADWIETEVVAESIVEHLEEEELEASFENGKAVWLDVLECEINDAIGKSIAYRLKEAELGLNEYD